MTTPTLETLVHDYLQDNAGFVGEGDLINAILALLEYNGANCQSWGQCTETNPHSDVYCGSRSIVEHAMGVLHRKYKRLTLG